MTYLQHDDNVPAPGTIIRDNDYLAQVAHRERLCPGCDEKLGGRKVATADDNHVVHAKCRYDHNAALKAHAHTRRIEAEEAEMAERRAQCEANMARRGTTLVAFCEDMRSSRESAPELWSEFIFFDQARRTLESARKDLNTWTERVTGPDPANAFEWSGKAFTATARLKVYGIIELMFSRGMSHGDIVAECDRETVRRASSTSRSTSPTSNLMDDEILAAYANVSRRV